jgi:hypothetical protein
MNPIEKAMAKLTDALTKVRPMPFVRNMQAVFVFFTLAYVSYFLTSPFWGQEKLDISITGEFAEGKNAPRTIVSSKEIIYEDKEKTRMVKEKAFESAPYYFTKDYSLLSNNIIPLINEDIETLKELSNSDNRKNFPFIRQKIPRWKNRSDTELQLLTDSNQKYKIRQGIIQYTSLVFSNFCILKDPHPEKLKVMTVGGRIRNLNNKDLFSNYEGYQILSRVELFQSGDSINRIESLQDLKGENANPALTPIFKRLSLGYLYNNPNCIYNHDETLVEKSKAADKVDKINAKISTNEVILRSGDLITPEVYSRLEILNIYATRANITSIISTLITQIIFVAIIGIFLRKYSPKRLNDVSSNLVIFSILWFTILVIQFAGRTYFNIDSGYESIYYFALFVPIGMTCLLISFIYESELAIAIGFYVSFIVFIASHYNPTSFTMAFTSCVAASVYGRKLQKRIDFFKAALLLGAVLILIAWSGYLFDSRNYWTSNPSGNWLSDLVESNIAKLFLLCLANGFISAMGAQIVLPIYEYIFNIPTRFKLIELADTGHPLLQQLLTKAPSTYTHTFLVAAMSERAARNLGLDWLLTRVGVYFHDIGKIPNAGFFIENQHLIPKLENIDKNNPSLAAKVVIDHVLDGIEMARKARLPREVINFIPEHHGTSTMAFFYHKALSSLPLNQRRKIQKEDFQYPGPKPQSKETAIVMIADSLEAASRSLDDISEASLDELIQKIINSKLAENQLDESDLTFGDIQVIKKSFKEVLLSSLHQRPKYPKPEETKELELKKPKNKK